MTTPSCQSADSVLIGITNHSLRITSAHGVDVVTERGDVASHMRRWDTDLHHARSLTRFLYLILVPLWTHGAANPI
jgi:hypothetical protein